MLVPATAIRIADLGWRRSLILQAAAKRAAQARALGDYARRAFAAGDASLRQANLTAP